MTTATVCHGPINHCLFLGRSSAEKFWIWNFSHSPQVKAVGIETGLYRDIGMAAGLGMITAGNMQELKVLSWQVKIMPTQNSGQFRTTPPMVRIAILILPAAIMKQGKELDNLLIGTGFPGQA